MKNHDPTAQTKLKEHWMAQHISRSKQFRDFTRDDIKQMTERNAWELFCEVRWGSKTYMPCPTCHEIDKHYPNPARKQ